MTKSVLIIGSGILGLYLAEKFSKNDYRVFITTTTKSKLLQLQDLGYNALIFDSNEHTHYEQLNKLQVDVLVYALAPSKCKTINYTEVLNKICSGLNSFNILAFTSSISVYLNNKQIQTEISEALELNSIIYQTELYIKEHINNYYIFRLGGLIDKQRHPKNFHKSIEVKESNARVNLVHIKDVSEIIHASISNKIDFGIYNICSPQHPTKKEYYGSFNELLNFSEGDLGKTIDGSLISILLKYNYTSIYDFITEKLQA